MPKAFARIPASVIENFLEGGDLPPALEEALEEAIKNARENDEMDGEAPIQIFITDDSSEEEESEE